MIMDKNNKIWLSVAIAVAIIVVVATVGLIIGVDSMGSAVGEEQNYEFGEDFLPTDLEIEIGGADVRIEQGEKFLVKSNLKYLNVRSFEGKATIKERTHSHSDYENAFLTIYLPEGVSLTELQIKTGAGRFYAESLSAEVVDLEFGAGEVTIDKLVATKDANIEGGAGKITIGDGSLRNLELVMGVGELALTTEIVGEGELVLGVGQTTLNILGLSDSYTFKMTKGIGDMTFNGSSVGQSTVIGNGTTEVEIVGGIGSISLITE